METTSRWREFGILSFWKTLTSTQDTFKNIEEYSKLYRDIDILTRFNLIPIFSVVGGLILISMFAFAIENRIIIRGILISFVVFLNKKYEIVAEQIRNFLVILKQPVLSVNIRPSTLFVQPLTTSTM